MALAPNITEDLIRHEAAEASVTVVAFKTSWIAPEVERSLGEAQKPGVGARLAVQKFGAAINKLADS